VAAGVLGPALAPAVPVLRPVAPLAWKGLRQLAGDAGAAHAPVAVAVLSCMPTPAAGDGPGLRLAVLVAPASGGDREPKGELCGAPAVAMKHHTFDRQLAQQHQQ
jgi:hypothetical protein